MVYLDYSKAFDLESHVLLLQNDSCLIDWMQDFLLGQIMRISVAGHCFEVALTSGVPLETMFGQLLFMFYVDNITKMLLGLGVLVQVILSLVYAILEVKQQRELRECKNFSGMRTLLLLRVARRILN